MAYWHGMAWALSVGEGVFGFFWFFLKKGEGVVGCGLGLLGRKNDVYISYVLTYRAACCYVSYVFT